jgi:peptide/nickel transport system permease protein
VARRILHALFVVFGVSLAVFFLSHLSGDPTLLMIQPGASQEDVAALRHRLGFDQPLPVQYAQFLSRAVQADFGNSLWQNQPALPLVLERMPATLQLTLAAMAISTVVSVPAGIIAAIKRGSVYDSLVMLVSLLGQSIPVYWLGLMLILTFGVRFELLPTSGYGSISHLILPAITLAAYAMARNARLVRSGMLDVLGQDYIRTARAKGLVEGVVVLRHGLRNAAIPVVTLLALDFGALLGGAVITETIFAWPGVGRLVMQAIFQRDFPLVQAAVFVVAITFVLINLAVDILYTMLDPRIRLG